MIDPGSSPLAASAAVGGAVQSVPTTTAAGPIDLAHLGDLLARVGARHDASLARESAQRQVLEAEAAARAAAVAARSTASCQTGNEWQVVSADELHRLRSAADRERVAGLKIAELESRLQSALGDVETSRTLTDEVKVQLGEARQALREVAAARALDREATASEAQLATREAAEQGAVRERLREDCERLRVEMRQAQGVEASLRAEIEQAAVARLQSIREADDNAAQKSKSLLAAYESLRDRFGSVVDRERTLAANHSNLKARFLDLRRSSSAHGGRSISDEGGEAVARAELSVGRQGLAHSASLTTSSISVDTEQIISMQRSKIQALQHECQQHDQLAGQVLIVNQKLGRALTVMERNVVLERRMNSVLHAPPT